MRKGLNRKTYQNLPSLICVKFDNKKDRVRKISVVYCPSISDSILKYSLFITRLVLDQTWGK